MFYKIPSRVARQNFLKRADVVSLDEYLMNMQKLAIKKGGEYKIAYDEDIAFLMDRDDDDDDMDASNALALFSREPSINMTETVEETEMYVNKIERLTQNTRNKKYDIMDEIEDILIDEHELFCNSIKNNGKHKLSYNAKDAIYGFVDILLAENINQMESTHDLALRIYKKILRNKNKYHGLSKKENSMVVQASNRIMELLPKDSRNVCLKEYFWEYQNIKKNYPRELQKSKIQQLNDKYAKYRDVNKLPVEWIVIAKIIRRRAKEDVNIRQTS